MPFFYALKGLSNKHQLIFTFKGIESPEGYSRMNKSDPKGIYM